jgi:hypothetical protein
MLGNSIVQEGYIIAETERDLDTGDPMNDPLLPGTKLIAAWGDSDEMQYHGSDDRLQGTVRFFGEPGAMDDVAIFEYTMKNEAGGGQSC